uniref:Sulfurtransferase n=1 Tax=Dracunculus medinensis TaxID=318479 RepID=A0A0N4U0Y2_DRAME
LIILMIAGKYRLLMITEKYLTYIFIFKNNKIRCLCKKKKFYRRYYREEHIESAKLLEWPSLSHSGVPIHPLQFQRLLRNLGVDSDCHVILYDRGEVIWSTYAFWIFQLFGHAKISLLAGGLLEWKRLQSNSTQYRIESGAGDFVSRIGNFRSQWNSNIIYTFDDVMNIVELKNHDLIDAQDKEHYSGIGKEAVYGHIRTALNIPIDDVYDWHKRKWLDANKLFEIFIKKGLSRSRRVVIYCATSLKASMIFYALQKCDYDCAIYFGSWSEWLIRAPDFLKVVPEKNV